MMYLRGSLATGTQRTYASAVAGFRRWRRERGSLEEELPTIDELGSWLSMLAEGGGANGPLAIGTLRTYNAAIGAWWLEMRRPGSGAPNPSSDEGIQRILKGIEREQAMRAEIRPLGIDAGSRPLLLPTLLRLPYGAEARERMMRAAAYLGVGAGLRPGELLGSSDNPHRALRREQLSFYADGAGKAPLSPPGDGATPGVLQLTLRSTKTSQFMAVIKYITAEPVVAAAWRWYCDTDSRGSAALLFQLTPDSPALNSNMLIGDLRRRLDSAGYADVAIGGKSWRQGGAGTLAAQGVDEADIAALGWAAGSRQWERYARDPQVQRQRAIAVAGLMRTDVAGAPSR